MFGRVYDLWAERFTNALLYQLSYASKIFLNVNLEKIFAESCVATKRKHFDQLSVLRKVLSEVEGFCGEAGPAKVFCYAQALSPWASQKHSSSPKYIEKELFLRSSPSLKLRRNPAEALAKADQKRKHFGEEECRDPGSNWGRQDFQSCALPTELSRQNLQ